MPTDSSAFLLLLNWMSPAFPTGSFAYSHGLEWVISSGEVKTADDVESWIGDLMRSGSAWNDAVLFTQCWHGSFEDLNALALALAGSAERYLEATQLGRGFSIAASAWTGAEPFDGHIAYPIAAGTCCKGMNVPVEDAVLAFLQGFSASLVSVAVRLVPLGQTAGLHVLRNLAPVIEKTARRAAAASLDDLGSNTISADISAMKHETLESRVFRT